MGAEHRLGNQVRAERIRQEIRGYLEEVDHPMFIPTFLGLGLEARLERHYEDAEMYFSEGLKICPPAQDPGLSSPPWKASSPIWPAKQAI